MKKIEKKLKNEINNVATPDFFRVARECGISNNRMEIKKVALVSGKECEDNVTPYLRKKWIIIALVVALLVSLVVVSIMMINKEEDPFTNGGHFIIDINPSIEISYDEEGNVTSVTPLNEDAEVLLYGVDLVGKNYEKAVANIIDNCIELGYISTERADNAVMTTAVSTSGEKNEKMTEIIKEAFTKEFSTRKILGVVIAGIDNSELNEEAQKYGVDGQKLGLIREYISKGGKLEEEEYSKISIRELYFGIYDLEKEEKNNNLEKAKEETNAKILELNNQLKLFVEALKDIVLLDDKYINYADKLDDMLDRLDDPSCDIENISNEILKIAEELKENDITMFISVVALEEILLPYIDSFNEKRNELNELDKPLEEKRNERKEQFKESIKTEIEHNVDDWQSKLEEEFSKNWFEYRDEWNGINNSKDGPEDKPKPNNGINSSQEFENGKKG